MVDHHKAGEQLTFIVRPHPAARDGWLAAQLEVGGTDRTSAVPDAIVRAHKAKLA